MVADAVESRPPGIATTRASTTPALQILLVGNYARDHQESMLRFTAMVAGELAGAGVQYREVSPGAVCGVLASSAATGVGKWLAYIDKYLLFPWRLRREWHAARRERKRVVIHICDHSNALYTRWIPGAAVVVTCHDLLAVRGARGEETDCPATRWGRLLQQSIVDGLSRATIVACVSEATRRDAARILGGKTSPLLELVPLGLHYPYAPMDAKVADVALSPLALPPGRFLLHVGSNLRRKNRDGALRIFARVQSEYDGTLVFAGEPLDNSLRALAVSLGVQDRVREVVAPTNAVLQALYNRAHALLFPSRFEGFGWPIIEAQACACPVICADADPMAEVAGAAGLRCPIDDEESFARAVMRLCDPQTREHAAAASLENAQRFTAAKMREQYLALHEKALTLA